MLSILSRATVVPVHTYTVYLVTNPPWPYPIYIVVRVLWIIHFILTSQEHRELFFLGNGLYYYVCQSGLCPHCCLCGDTLQFSVHTQSSAIQMSVVESSSCKAHYELHSWSFIGQNSTTNEWDISMTMNIMDALSRFKNRTQFIQNLKMRKNNINITVSYRFWVF